jgi:metallo-beta-lactamase family protein
LSESLSISFFGATQTVTGSKYLLRTGKINILVDCGIFQGSPEVEQRNFSPFPIDPASIDAVILTHAHIDHCGYLPCLVKNGYSGEILCTPATAALLHILLPDAGRLQEEQAAYANKKGYSRYRPALPLYTSDDALRALERLRQIPFETPTEITRHIVFTPRPAGHILGACFLMTEVFLRRRTVRILFSGDLGRYQQIIMNPPSPPPDADYVLLESTYGDRLHPKTPVDLAIGDIVRRIAHQGGVLLIPSFAVGRTQQILYILRRLEESGEIPRLPVFVDSPMAIDATDLYRRFAMDPNLNLPDSAADASPFQCGHLTLVRSQEESKSLNSRDGPMIIIAGSGMCDGGRITHHLKHRLEDPRNAVLLVGYQAEGTRGRLLKDGAKTVMIHGRPVSVNAKILALEGLSAHADRDDLLRWLRGLSNPPTEIFIVHGELPAATALQAEIRSSLGWHATIPPYLHTAAL